MLQQDSVNLLKQNCAINNESNMFDKKTDSDVTVTSKPLI